MQSYRILCGDVREKLAEIASGSVQTCVTSPPYFGLRDYGQRADGRQGRLLYFRRCVVCRRAGHRVAVAVRKAAA